MEEIKSLKIIAPKHDKGQKYIEVNGKKYVLDNDTETSIIQELNFKELVDSEEYERTLDIMAEKISKKVKIKKLIKQVLYALPMKEFKEVKEEMDKEKPRIRNNEGCYFLTVGKNKLPLRD